ncbi:hypothetical protein BKA70DRAFT_1297072 [Coprinopsis sp. MPI-PUGE-AT-0042]|nr:hypothetical protein BKA70DRAFT_1297072 [Coprinopsis sp. MPI-PUGE-AT-0042]
MAPIAFAGALAPKKKSELQDIALALRISDQGTKEDIQTRIKKHLDNNPNLEDDSRFSGLYGRKRRGSAQPQPQPNTRLSVPAPEKPRSSTRNAPLDPIRETTPQADLRDVSRALKQAPLSPDTDSDNDDDESPSPQKQTPASPFKTVPIASPVVEHKPLDALPPPLSPGKAIIEAFSARPAEIIEAISNPQEIMESIPKPADLKAAVQNFQPQEYLPNGAEYLEATRAFLSNSQNIWTASALLELCYILNTVIPYKYFDVPLTPSGAASPLSITLRYPPLSTFQTSAFWMVLLHWAIPTLIAPALMGNLISFSPAASQAPRPTSLSAPRVGQPASAPFDPLTAAIVRLAASLAYPYATLASVEHIYGLDVLGWNVRVFNAALGLAFAFAEAVQGAPTVFAKKLVEELEARPEVPGRKLNLEGGKSRLALEGSMSEEVD